MIARKHRLQQNPISSHKITNLILKKTNKTKVVMVKVDWCKIMEEIKRKEYKLLGK